jgi:hypothetical protein
MVLVLSQVLLVGQEKMELNLNNPNLVYWMNQYLVEEEIHWLFDELN